MPEVLTALAELQKSGGTGVLCTIVKTKGSTPRKEGCKMLVYQDGTIKGTIGGGEVEGRVIKEALEAIQSGEPTLCSYDLINPDQGDPGLCGGSLEIFIDPLIQSDDLVVIGGGHVGKAIIHLANWLGFRVILTDDREEFCSSDSAPGAAEYIHCPFEEITKRYKFSSQTAVVLATRNNKLDILGLPELLKVPTGYIGVISSKRRWKLTEEQLRESGVNKNKLEQIHAPIGLDIQADTPEEIALSIMAEIIQEKHGGTGKSFI